VNTEAAIDFWAQKVHLHDCREYKATEIRVSNTDDDEYVDFPEAIGASASASIQVLTLYLPSKDREGKAVANLESWIEEGLALLAEIGGGATAWPPAEGVWKGEDGNLIREKTSVIYCYVIPDRFRANLPSLRAFLHRFGRTTNQGEVALEWDGQLFRITTFD
jgi:hypothetical protein